MNLGSARSVQRNLGHPYLKHDSRASTPTTQTFAIDLRAILTRCSDRLMVSEPPAIRSSMPEPQIVPSEDEETLAQRASISLSLPSRVSTRRPRRYRCPCAVRTSVR